MDQDHGRICQRIFQEHTYEAWIDSKLGRGDGDEGYRTLGQMKG